MKTEKKPERSRSVLGRFYCVCIYIYIYRERERERAPFKARNFNVVYIYGPAFGNAESRLFLFAAQCFNIESMQKVILWHSCV
jgi:hypothetical protein